jgi:hypothetical protein
VGDGDSICCKVDLKSKHGERLMIESEHNCNDESWGNDRARRVLFVLGPVECTDSQDCKRGCGTSVKRGDTLRLLPENEAVCQA